MKFLSHDGLFSVTFISRDLLYNLLFRLQQCVTSKTKLSDGLYKPDYRGAGLANLPSSVFLTLGCKWDGPPPLDKHYLNEGTAYNTVVLILVDALGWNLLKMSKNRINQVRNIINEYQPLPLTTVFPSTTSTVLTTLNTCS